MITVTGIIMIVTGVYLAYYLEGRKFYRRNGAGVEEFPSYSACLWGRFKEGAMGIGAGLFLIAGIFLAVGGLFA